ncbi:anaerobic ribonucleoside-triphosphate reductase activating protein [Candidatus Bathyarchaeota archaeon]|nr:anaerobic ribonucleoside-triphosphate reductase activating protein [Candidatus Bathyarchaeota archaeon]
MQTIRRSKRRVTEEFPIVGFEKLSLVDYPGKLCATLHTPGCNFRCPYCYQKKLIFDYIPMKKILVDEIIKVIHPRIGFLDGVTVTGGEPTIHRALPTLLARLKSIGALTKIDTNGSHPNILKILIKNNLINYVAMDIKAPFERYQELVQYKIDSNTILDSIQTIRRGHIDYEFRTTVVPNIINEKDLQAIAIMLAGSKKMVLQKFRPRDTLSEECSKLVPYSDNEMHQFKELVSPYFAEVKVRLW